MFIIIIKSRPYDVHLIVLKVIKTWGGHRQVPDLCSTVLFCERNYVPLEP